MLGHINPFQIKRKAIPGNTMASAFFTNSASPLAFLLPVKKTNFAQMTGKYQIYTLFSLNA